MELSGAPHRTGHPYIGEDAGFGALGALADESLVRIAEGRLTVVPHLGLGIRFR